MLVGSNGFNLAAMIGLSALIAGRVRLPRETLLLEGAVGLIVTVLAAVAAAALALAGRARSLLSALVRGRRTCVVVVGGSG